MRLIRWAAAGGCLPARLPAALARRSTCAGLRARRGRPRAALAQSLLSPIVSLAPRSLPHPLSRSSSRVRVAARAGEPRDGCR
jgi:hypothetical protein